MTKDNPLYVQALARGLALLETFETAGAPLTLTQMAELAGMDRSTAQRMTHTLVETGYLERGENGRGLFPGKRILDRSHDFMNSMPLLERASPILVDLQRETGERVELSLYDHLSIIFAMRRPTKRHHYNTTLAGRRLSIRHTAGGRAIMSQLPDDEIDTLLAAPAPKPRTRKTVTDNDGIRALIQEARRDGYAVSLEENMLGEINLAAPVVNASQRPVAALHVSGSLSEWDVADFQRRFAPAIVEGAKALSGRPGMS